MYEIRLSRTNSTRIQTSTKTKMIEYPQEVLKILEKEIRSYGSKEDFGGWVVYTLKREDTTLQVQVSDYGFGKKVFINDYQVGTIF